MLAKKTASKKKVAKKAIVSNKKSSVSKKKTTSVNKSSATRKKVISKKKVSKKKAANTPKRSGNSTDYQDFTPYKAKKGEEYMNTPQIEHFRALLIGWRKELMEEVDRTVHHMQDDAATYADPADRASQEEEFALELRTRDRERKLIKKISEAMNSLDSGEYGYCEACGIEIGVQRLEARPTATLCIDCKTLDEIKEKQRA